MASLLYPDDDRSQWPTSLLPVDDGTPPVLQADPRADALGQTYRAITEAIERQGGQAFRYANNPIGTETTRPEQTVSMPRDFVPAGTVGGGLWGDERPIAQRDVDAFRAGSEDLYNQASLLGGSRGVFEPPGGGGGAVTLASRRPLANPPPSTRGLLDVPAPAPEPPPTPPPGFTAYHGSPHSFDAFDLSKIGTGEGAQAYGHGMYLADAETTAQSYRDALAGKGGIFEWNGQAVPPGRPAFDLIDSLTDQNWRLGKIAEQAAKYGPRNAIDSFEPSTRNASDGPAWQAAMDQFKEGAGKSATGHMYEVQVNADPAHFLDWDKPLSEQHPKVQDAINGLADNSVALSQRMAEAQKNNIPLTGNDVVSTLARAGNFGDPRIAAALQKAGIPGIRYLDAGSRGAGEGSRNSVVFNPANMEIIRKYGLAGLMAGGGAAALSGQQGQQQQ